MIHALKMLKFVVVVSECAKGRILFKNDKLTCFSLLLFRGHWTTLGMIRKMLTTSVEGFLCLDFCLTDPFFSSAFSLH